MTETVEESRVWQTWKICAGVGVDSKSSGDWSVIVVDWVVIYYWAHFARGFHHWNKVQIKWANQVDSCDQKTWSFIWGVYNCRLKFGWIGVDIFVDVWGNAVESGIASHRVVLVDVTTVSDVVVNWIVVLKMLSWIFIFVCIWESNRKLKVIFNFEHYIPVVTEVDVIGICWALRRSKPLFISSSSETSVRFCSICFFFSSSPW